MLAAENGALPGGKVGGVADVVRELPRALADHGWHTTVLTPEYGLFGKLPGARPVASLPVRFAGDDLDVEVVDVTDTAGDRPQLRHLAFRHPLFHPHGARIYCDDGAARPFASDATKFALFCAAAATWIGQLDELPDVVHLHDWHAALYLLLRRFDQRHGPLADIRTVYTIHNLALQGVRPLRGDESSLDAWFPGLAADHEVVVDPRWPDCINPMASALRLADAINTVSPTYADEIQRANDPVRGFRGGEGLERDLATAARQQRLSGILNGCAYPARDRRRPGWRRLVDTAARQLYEWIVSGQGPGDIHEQSLARARDLPKRRPRNLMTSVGRMTEQKATLFLERDSGGARAIERILGSHARDSVLIVVGSGDPDYEKSFAGLMRHHANLLFLCGYSEPVGDLLYRAGDLFLMPSSFEPCGISQMLAMRASQPCVAHAVGGLADTVVDGVNGFTFRGDTPVEQADSFVASVSRAIAIRNSDEERWLRIRDRAQAERFSWSSAARHYIRRLYSSDQAGRPVDISTPG